MVYRSYKPPNILDVDCLYSLHYFHFTQGYTFTGEQHDFWELVYVDMGGVTLGNGGDEIPMPHGCACLHAPNVFHRIDVDYTAKTNLVVIGFGAKSDALYTIAGRSLPLNAECRRLIRMIVSEARQFCGPVLDISSQTTIIPRPDAPKQSGQIIITLLEQMLLRMLREEETSAIQQARRVMLTDEEEIQQMLAACEGFMLSHLDGSLRMQDICRHLGVSSTTLKRLFRDGLDTSVMEHYQQLRLQEACRLLRTGRFSITQVAAELGYSSLPAFSRQFRSRLNRTPREYLSSVSDAIDDEGVWHHGRRI